MENSFHIVIIESYSVQIFHEKNQKWFPLNVGTMLLLFMIGLLFLKTNAELTPIVLWHGFSELYYDTFVLSINLQLIWELPGVYVTSLRIGNNFIEDWIDTLFSNPNQQIAYACQTLQNDPKLKNGYNLIGLSQGGLLARVLAETCPDPPIKNLISMCSPQQGHYGLPQDCHGLLSPACTVIERIITSLLYQDFLQNSASLANDWHDAIDVDNYRNKNKFLAIMNNENQVKNDSYKENLLKVENFVLVKFTQDGLMVPPESAWFEFFEPGRIDSVVPLRNSSIYIEDWIGLQELDKSGRLHMLQVDDGHCKFSPKWFYVNILDPFLKE